MQTQITQRLLVVVQISLMVPQVLLVVVKPTQLLEIMVQLVEVKIIESLRMLNGQLLPEEEIILFLQIIVQLPEIVIQLVQVHQMA